MLKIAFWYFGASKLEHFLVEHTPDAPTRLLAITPPPPPLQKNLAMGLQNRNISDSRKSKKIFNVFIWGRGAVNLWAFRLCTVCSGPEILSGEAQIIVSQTGLRTLS